MPPPLLEQVLQSAKGPRCYSTTKEHAIAPVIAVSRCILTYVTDSRKEERPATGVIGCSHLQQHQHLHAQGIQRYCKAFGNSWSRPSAYGGGNGDVWYEQLATWLTLSATMSSGFFCDTCWARMASLPMYSGADCTLSPPWPWICQGRVVRWATSRGDYVLQRSLVWVRTLGGILCSIYRPHLRLRLSAHLQHHHRKASDAIVGARMVPFLGFIEPQRRE